MGVVGTTLLILTISTTIGQFQAFQSNPEHKIDGEV